MLIKQGQILKVNHSRKGEFIAKATRDFDSDVVEFYPVVVAKGNGSVLGASNMMFWMDRQEKVFNTNEKLKLFEGGRAIKHKPINNFQVEGENVVITHDEFKEVRQNDFPRFFEDICKRLNED
jgi:hypothetical protein